MKFRLSTGKEVYANNGIIGLGPEPDLAMFEGYDGNLNSFETVQTWDEDVKETDTWVLSRTERVEICEMMIVRWRTLYQQLSGKVHDP